MTSRVLILGAGFGGLELSSCLSEQLGTSVAVTLLALFTNFGLFLAFTLSRGTTEASHWPRLVTDLVASQVLVALATPWFTSLQARLIDLVETALELRSTRLR